MKKTREQIKVQEQTAGLSAADVAHAVAYAIDQPQNVAINEILLRPINQRT